MKTTALKLPLLGVLISVLALTFSSPTLAHVVVKPAEVVTAGFQTFTVGVPNEQDSPTTKLKLVIPAGLDYTMPVQKPGWRIDVEKEGQGEDAVVKSITWIGEVGVGKYDSLEFVAKVPENATDLQWKAYQTYADGAVVAWDKASSSKEHSDENSGPFSVTKVVTETEQDAAIKKADQAAADAKTAAERSLYVGAGGVVVGLLGVFLATRKK